MRYIIVRSVPAVAITLGFVLGGAGIASAAEGTLVDVKLPIHQGAVSAYNTEDGYRIELLPSNLESVARDAGAQGAAVNSPGIVSGNVIQVPVHVPVNACGNTISVVGLLNPTFGNYCVNK